MTREEAIQSLKDLAEINVRYGCDDKWIMALNMAIEALQREEAEEKGYCHRIKPKEYLKNDAINRAEQKLREMPRYLNGVKEKQIKKISADALPIHNDGTLEVKVPNAQKVGRVLVMDTDSHIGGGLFYPDDAEQGVWEHIESMWEDNIFKCSKCGNPLKIPTVDGEPIYNYCVHCGAKMGNAWGKRND